MTRYRYTEEDLKEAVATSGSVRQVLQKLKLVEAGGNYATTKRRIDNLNIDTSHFHGQAWSSGKNLGNRRPLEEYLSNNHTISSHHLRNRLIKEGVKLAKCEKCGIIEWNGQPAPLELEHKNGKHYDNSLDNLQILCPNCHAQTEHYRGRAKKHTA